jgi:hypothetical protein
MRSTHKGGGPPIGVIAFTMLYMLILGWMAFSRGGTEFIFYTLVMLVYIGGVVVLHLRIRFSVGVLAALSVWGFVHMAGGVVPSPADPERVLYAWRPIAALPRYDQFVHAYGFGVATLACWQGLRRSLRRDLTPSIGLCFLCALMGMGLGAINEIVEFIATHLDSEHGVGGYENTAWDLVANAAGAGLAAILIYVRPHAPR